MSRQADDRELLFGTISVARKTIGPEQFVEAAMAWKANGAQQPLDQAIRQHASIESDEYSTVLSIVDNSGSNEIGDESLADAIGDVALDALREAIERADESELRATIERIVESVDPGLALNRPEVAGDQQQRFEVREELASGGLGEVFVARDRQLNRNVALKQIRQRLVDHPSANDRFLLEAEITGRLEHPGVVPVYALGQKADGQYYYTMRLIRGVTLEDEIKSYFDDEANANAGSMNLKLRGLLRRFIDVCNTIDYAHSRGVVHRDLKPANIMLGKYGETLVVDWGLAKQVGVEEYAESRPESLLVPGGTSGSSATQFGSAIGTPHYMSPEQAAGRLDRIGPASDVYSLGATFFHLLTGVPPHRGSTVEVLLDKIQHGDFPSPRSVRHSVARPLEAICLKAMSLRVSERYASAREMASDIDRWLADQPVDAYQEPWLASVGRGLRRHQTLAVTLTVASILLGIAAFVGSEFARQSEARELSFEQERRQQELVRERDDLQQLAQRRANAAANLSSGLREAAAGRFDSALNFFRQGEEACANESRLENERIALTSRSQQMEKLIEFGRLSDEGVFANSMEEDYRAMTLFAAGLRRLGVFEHSDWWDHLPVDGLDPRHADQIERRVNSQLAMICSLLGKSVATVDSISRRTLGLPIKKSVELERRYRLAHVTGDMSLAYRPSQWTSHFKEMGRYFESQRATIPDVPEWQGDTFTEGLILGQLSLSLSFAGAQGFANDLVKSFLRLEGTTEQARRFIARASEFNPSDESARAILGWIEMIEGDYAAARNALAHAIALRPNWAISYVLRSEASRLQAMEAGDAAERQRLLQLALEDARSARESAPRHEMVFWVAARVLRQLGQDAQAVDSYLEAIRREPPVEMITAVKWQFAIQGNDVKRVRRMGYYLDDRFEEVQQYAKELRENSPNNLLFLLLEASIAHALSETEAARSAAESLLELASDEPTVSPAIVASAHAILGEIHADAGQWTLARESFARALQVDARNTVGATGMAETLEQQARESNDRAQWDRALAAWDELAAIADTDWQAVLAQSGRYRVLVETDQFDQASVAIDRLLDADRGYDLSPLRSFAQNRGAETLVQRIDGLRFDVQVLTATKDQLPAQTLPLRNGNFELGLNAHWEPWRVEGDCLADANVQEVLESESAGGATLLIDHRSARSDHSRGVLEQVIPAWPGKRCRITLSGKARAATEGGASLVVDDQYDQPVIRLTGGTYKWQEFVGEFVTTSASEFPEQPGLTKIQIVSSSPGEYWIDDISITLVGE